MCREILVIANVQRESISQHRSHRAVSVAILIIANHTDISSEHYDAMSHNEYILQTPSSCLLSSHGAPAVTSL